MIRNYQVYMKKFAHTNITSNTVETWENQVEKKKKNQPKKTFQTSLIKGKCFCLLFICLSELFPTSFTGKKFCRKIRISIVFFRRFCSISTNISSDYH